MSNFDVNQIAREVYDEISVVLQNVRKEHRGIVSQFRLASKKREIMDHFEEALNAALAETMHPEEVLFEQSIY